MQIDKANSLAQTSDSSKLKANTKFQIKDTFNVKNEDGSLVPFDESRFNRSVRNALDKYSAKGDASLSPKEVAAQTFEALSHALSKSKAIDAHDIRTQIEMSIVLQSSNSA